MKISGVFSLKSNIIISFQTPWNEPVTYKVNDILFCGTKEFMIDKIDRIYQGCFGTPINRLHSLMLVPVGHNDKPSEGDEITFTPPPEKYPS